MRPAEVKQHGRPRVCGSHLRNGPELGKRPVLQLLRKATPFMRYTSEKIRGNTSRLVCALKKRQVFRLS